MGTPMPRDGRQPEGLTCIRARIHCVATQDRVGPDNETDRIMIDNFLRTLSEVALALAARNSEAKQTDERA